MERLFAVQPTSSDLELFRTAEEGIRNALKGNSDQFFYNIDYYLSLLPRTTQKMSARGKAELEHLAERNGWKKYLEVIEGLSDEYAAIMHNLRRYVFVGVDMEKEGYPTALYTRGVNTLRAMHQQGQIEGDLEKVVTSLEGSKTEKSVKEGTFVVCRLDLSTYRNGQPIFKAVIPRSNLEIGGGKQFVFIPVPFYYIFDDLLKVNFGMNPFKFTKSSVVGKLSHNVAITPDVVRHAYQGNDGHLVESKLRKAKIGYDVAKQRYFAYDLEASLHSLGIASFRPEMLDNVNNIFYDDIDKSRHDVNFNHLRGIFKTRINALNKDQLENLHFMNLQSYATMKDMVEAVVEAADKKPDAELFFFMKNNPDIFGDLEDALQKRARVAPKFLKEMTEITLPVDEIQRKEVLEDMMERGIIKFTATTKSGSIFERLCSNNPAVLQRMIGKDYIKTHESIRNKLKHVRQLLEQGKIKSKLSLEKVGVEYNLLDHVDPMYFFSDGIVVGDATDAIMSIDHALNILQAKMASKQANPSNLLYRNVQAHEPKDFFGSINVNNVIAVDFSEVK